MRCVYRFDRSFVFIAHCSFALSPPSLPYFIHPFSLPCTYLDWFPVAIYPIRPASYRRHTGTCYSSRWSSQSSSAFNRNQIITTKSISLVVSFTHTTKRTSPNTDPCGTYHILPFPYFLLYCYLLFPIRQEILHLSLHSIRTYMPSSSYLRPPSSSVMHWRPKRFWQYMSSFV